MGKKTVWFFQSIRFSLALLEEANRTLWQEWTRTPLDRQKFSQDLAHFLWQGGVLSPSGERRPITSLLTQDLLARCLLWFLEGGAYLEEEWQEWTCTQAGWYSPAQGESDESAATEQRSPVSLLPGRNTYPWRTTRSSRPGRYPRRD